jgi:hypothetical protein
VRHGAVSRAAKIQRLLRDLRVQTTGASHVRSLCGAAGLHQTTDW